MVCLTHFQEITSSQHDKVFGDLLRFILSSHQKLQSLHTILSENVGTPFTRRKLPPRLEVSTAVLITGVNMPDHAVLFERLEKQIHDNCSPFVVLLRARDCNSGRGKISSLVVEKPGLWIQCIRNEGNHEKNPTSADEHQH